MSNATLEAKLPKLIPIDFQPGTSRHKMLQVLSVNGGSVPSRSSLYNLTSGVVAGPLGAPTRASDAAVAYEYQLERQGFVECDKSDMPRSMGVRLTKKGENALYTADQAIATADPNSPWAVGKNRLSYPNRMGHCDNYYGPANFAYDKTEPCQLVEDPAFPTALRKIMDHRFSHLAESGGKRRQEYHMTYTAEESWWLKSRPGDINPDDLVKLTELTHRVNSQLIDSIIPKLESIAQETGLALRYTVMQPYIGDGYAYNGRRINYFDPANQDDIRRAVGIFLTREKGEMTHFDVSLALKMALAYPKKGN